ncbi:hypothetical protein BCR32DRAFT_248832 [Anaeromyces robustus]|uniref:Uncharacterized protein n=1 Tax=Anaeromyces robustus TaxID=1754192 RepID=A0A1Y1WSN7_9FUNG|nr:hypothetical protein BCR32DRAFT_248832 [Anaeromyces robustus]|eukprot:ORX76308.1 hypothetical protein BCR32DRAFT_248832 [Anaeromyces robustus]
MKFFSFLNLLTILICLNKIINASEINQINQFQINLFKYNIGLTVGNTSQFIDLINCIYDQSAKTVNCDFKNNEFNGFYISVPIIKNDIINNYDEYEYCNLFHENQEFPDAYKNYILASMLSKEFNDGDLLYYFNDDNYENYFECIMKDGQYKRLFYKQVFIKKK